MSLSHPLNLEQLFKEVEKKANRDKESTTALFWKYYDYDGNFIGCTVKTIKKENGKKQVKPWVFKDNKWLCEGFCIDKRTIYGIEQLKLNPDKPILFVEGEKTADAGKELFPEFNVITWLGGTSAAKNADLSLFNHMKIYLLPDNDSPGIKAMNILADALIQQENSVFKVNVTNWNVPEKWDIADLDSEHGDIDSAMVRELVLNTPQFVPPLADYPDMSDTKKPYPLDTTDNIKHMLNLHGITMRYNMMKRLRDAYVPDVEFYDEETENASLTYITNLAVKCGLKINRIDKHLDAIAWSNTYHPVRDWILSRPLKDKGILKEFLQILKTTNDSLSQILLKRWMISAVAALFSDAGFCAQGVLVLQGEQYTHKSSFIMSLAPPTLGAIKGGLSLDPSKKDDIFTSSECWIGELAELDATFRKADIARLKSHIANDIDIVRRPYATRNSRMARRSVLAATVNEPRFLIDVTGNRRWWTISITEPINTRHGLDMQQIWREIYELWKEGASPILLLDELEQLNALNKQFEYLEPFELKLQEHFDDEWPQRVWMNATQVLSILGYNNPSKSETTRMGNILTKKGYQKGTGRLRYSYLMPRMIPQCETFM